MLPDWVFRIGWGFPIARDYLQVRMEAAQLATSIPEARNARQVLNSAVANKSAPADANRLRWAIKTSVPAGPDGDSWGDLYFAQEIVDALIRKGHWARVDRRSEVINSNSIQDDVVLVLRGIERIRPQYGAINLLWIISHPSRISKNEIALFDRVFAASNKWSAKYSKQTGIEILPLLQATNPEKFNPDVAKLDSGDAVLFIGNTRHKFRRIIKDSLSAGIKPTIYGQGWNEFVEAGLIAGTFVPNSKIAGKYRSAGVVLNDHWADMAKFGFYSNRLFDATSAGARVISDEVDGLAEIFGGAVQTYKTLEQLTDLTSPAGQARFGTPQEITDRARQLGSENSFDERVGHLIAAAQQALKSNLGK